MGCYGNGSPMGLEQLGVPKSCEECGVLFTFPSVQTVSISVACLGCAVRCCAEWFGSAVSSEFQSCSGVLSSFGSALLLCLGLPSCSAGLCLALRSLVSAGREKLCS
ncbi:hypothetical protein MRB53_028514 [Persea americana]|uniref:Uncharacterized protein n=1 Tax=Persea americana TaxID=3435 RepID=A0ACC2KFQ7_PERAE|nr:hypothetical protein MRB53_028514 [Persea americana]